ncbi:hypothetical protein BFJ70_g13996 [Fusarium oxysporum]|nr:hypothetical protein FOMA001_g10721 [Fusarium oxysporum f. sp. matthiolae]RKL19060.1 hypothetical protein BFJ70_g13996 [Fusarium oxysporum]
MDGGSSLCSSCSIIDFTALFKAEIKCFHIGTLAAIAQRKNCSFCCFVVQVIEIIWAKWKDEVWEPSLSASINIWVKTTLWAQYGVSSEKKGRNENTPHFRHRPALGADFEPDERQRSSYGSPRYTLCELDRVRSPGSFKYFTDHLGEDIDQTLSRRRIPPLVDRDLLKTWIRECQTNHARCMVAGENKQDLLRSTGRFRVIDVEANCLVVPSQDISYIAFSYVWGGILSTKTDSERVKWVESLFEPSPSKESTDTASHGPGYRLRVENLPTTIRDSIKLTSLMGWRYMWIDLLCIHQNDTSDKEVLVKKMHLIYEEASFTMVAAGGNNASTPLAGLFSPRGPEPMGEIVYKNESILMALARPRLPDLLAETVWATRGWTFQEDVLSRCCLYFTATEVLYSCKSHLKQFRLPSVGHYKGFGIGRYNEWRESYVLETRLLKTAYQDTSPWNDGWNRKGSASSCLRSRASILDPSNTTETNRPENIADIEAIYGILSRKPEGSFDSNIQHIPVNESVQPFEEYARFLADYSKRHLSNPDDIVEAMMGILNKFNMTSGISANIDAHGLLVDQLEKSLLWVALRETSLRRRRGLPSWSWAGWVGPIVYEIITYLIGRGYPSPRRWIFQPPRPYTKKRGLSMDSLFDIYISTENSLIAIVKKARLPNPPMHYPPDTPPDYFRSPGILNMYTYIAQVSSISNGTSAVVRRGTTEMDVPILLVRLSSDDEQTAVIPDSRLTAPIKDCGKYHLAIIGKGERKEDTDGIDDEEFMRNFITEYVVLLLEKRGEYFERVGLAVAPAGRNVAEESKAASVRSSGVSDVTDTVTSITGLTSPFNRELADPPSAWSLQWVSLA